MESNRSLFSPNDVTFSRLSRALMAGIFISAGVSKLRNREMTEQYMASKKLPLRPLLRNVAAAVEIGGATSLLLGRKHKLGASALALFLVPTTLIFHNFWSQKGEARMNEAINFFKNLAIMGGLVEIARHRIPRRHSVSSSAGEGVETRVLEESLPESIEIIEIDEQVA